MRKAGFGGCVCEGRKNSRKNKTNLLELKAEHISHFFKIRPVSFFYANRLSLKNVGFQKKNKAQPCTYYRKQIR